MEDNGAQQPRNKLMFLFFGPGEEGEEQIKRENIQECFYMTHIDNLPSILQNGLLSHRRIEKLNPGRKDVSNPAVQARRAEKIIQRVNPTKRSRSLHRFVNLYLNPHNAMMINVIHGGLDGFIKQERTNMCVLRIRGEILDRGDAILTDQNAATNAADFFTAEAFVLDARRTAAITDCESVGYLSLQKHPQFLGWNSDDIKNYRKQTRQAEALLPYKVGPRYIFGILVCDGATQGRVEQVIAGLERNDISVSVNQELFLPTQYGKLTHYTPHQANAGMDEIDHEIPSSDESGDEGVEHAIALKRVGI